MTAPRPSDAPLRLGTRRSLLAQAQSSWVARRLEEIHPGLRIELVGIETRGDQLLDVPLSTAPGREFFVAELDAALIAGDVDFTVHSYKDLSLERPPELVLAAIPERANPRDVLLFGPAAQDRLAESLPLRIGTGAPRRIANLADFLPSALPGPVQPPPEFVSIRGNVDTRLSRIHLPDPHERHVDAVVLALAGLSRLWSSDSGRARLAPLLADAAWMILPLRECPTAPAQGALAIECRAADASLRQKLAALHHPDTADHVARERQLLAEWGGGCHQALGATSFSAPGVGRLLHIRGRKPDGTPVAETLLKPSADVPSPGSGPQAFSSPSFAFIPNLSPTLDPSRLANHRVWAGDMKIWHALARAGVWVEGCGEDLGLEALHSTLAEPILGLAAPSLSR